MKSFSSGRIPAHEMEIRHFVHFFGVGFNARDQIFDGIAECDRRFGYFLSSGGQFVQDYFPQNGWGADTFLRFSTKMGKVSFCC